MEGDKEVDNQKNRKVRRAKCRKGGKGRQWERKKGLDGRAADIQIQTFQDGVPLISMWQERRDFLFPIQTENPVSTQCLLLTTNSHWLSVCRSNRVLLNVHRGRKFEYSGGRIYG